MIPLGELRARYDAEMRRDPVPDPHTRVDRDGPVVRVLGDENYVIYSDLEGADAARVVAEQVAYFRRVGQEVEWKTFGHDRPADLEAILARAGFVPDEPETLVVFDLREGLPGGPVPADVTVRRVTDRAGLRDAATANDAAFGAEGTEFLERWSDRLDDPNVGLFVAYVEGSPAATGRVQLTPGRSFAGLWGGGTAPPHRHRGVYRSLVRVRASFARDYGHRFLTVDARETSRPILERLGFVRLTTTRAWVLRPGKTA
ncbi:MAG: GNAT family N-acetyltransferase [Thermoplasmata archaeon]